MDVAGQVLLSEAVPAGATAHTLVLGICRSGLYFVRVGSGAGVGSSVGGVEISNCRNFFNKKIMQTRTKGYAPDAT
ncbi:MAG: hypothetical protein IPK76_03710 [Lewinellaceae bacterium]|nr:hypothetical protein [Lewinellaceae bacterium]